MPARRRAGGRRQRIARGFPDLTLVRDGALVFAELKRDTTRPTDDQIAWHAALEAVPGVEVYVWRPRDWDAIVDRLSRGRQVVPASFPAPGPDDREVVLQRRVEALARFYGWLTYHPPDNRPAGTA